MVAVGDEAVRAEGDVLPVHVLHLLLRREPLLVRQMLAVPSPVERLRHVPQRPVVEDGLLRSADELRDVGQRLLRHGVRIHAQHVVGRDELTKVVQAIEHGPGRVVRIDAAEEGIEMSPLRHLRHGGFVVHVPRQQGGMVLHLVDLRFEERIHLRLRRNLPAACPRRMKRLVLEVHERHETFGLTQVEMLTRRPRVGHQTVERPLRVLRELRGLHLSPVHAKREERFAVHEAALMFVDPDATRRQGCRAREFADGGAELFAALPRKDARHRMRSHREILHLQRQRRAVRGEFRRLRAHFGAIRTKIRELGLQIRRRHVAPRIQRGMEAHRAGNRCVAVGAREHERHRRALDRTDRHIVERHAPFRPFRHVHLHTDSLRLERNLPRHAADLDPVGLTVFKPLAVAAPHPFPVGVVPLHADRRRSTTSGLEAIGLHQT